MERQFIFLTAPCPCCRWSSPPIFAACAREVDRLVLSCIMEIDPQGEVAFYELAEGVIRSARRMTYTEVNAVIEGDPHARQQIRAALVGEL